MRFVSKYPRLGLGTVVKEKFVLALDGQRDQVQDSVSVQFDQSGLGMDDVRFATSYWPEKSFTGRWIDADGITLQPVAERIGMFDTLEAQKQNGWSDELREKVEKWMLAKSNYGTDFTEVEVVPAEAPWPSYDKTHHSKVASLAAELGLVDGALVYERSNKNRKGIIEALETEQTKPSLDAEGELVNA